MKGAAKRGMVRLSSPIEGCHAGRLDHPEAQARRDVVVAHARGVGPALGEAQGLRQELHHARVGVERREGREVGVAPVAQQQSLGRELGHDAGGRARSPA